MRRVIITLVVLALGVVPHAQAQNSIPEFDKLRTPSSPAFVILGVSPTEVQRPTTPSTFAASLLQGFVPQGDGGTLDDFAVEVAPYWLVSHPNLRLRDYHGGSWFQNFVRTFTVSGATVKVEDSEASTGESRDLGVGIRAAVFQGAPPSDKCIEQTERTISALTSISSQVAMPIAAAIAADPGLADDATRLEALRVRLFDEALENLPPDEKEVIDAKVLDCTAILSAKRGFVMDVAAASGWRFADGQLDGSDWRSGAVWATPSFIQQNVSVVGLARYNWGADDAGDLLDLGLRGVYAWDRYGVSAEGVFRRPQGDGDNLYRLALTFDVLLTGDVWLTTSFGRDFNEDDAGSLLAIANLQWNVGDRSVKPSPAK